jgi:hypothetical protein
MRKLTKDEKLGYRVMAGFITFMVSLIILGISCGPKRKKF